MDTLKFVESFTHWRTSTIFQFFFNKQSCFAHWYTGFQVNLSFHFFGFEISESYDNGVFVYFLFSFLFFLILFHLDILQNLYGSYYHFVTYCVFFVIDALKPLILLKINNLLRNIFLFIDNKIFTYIFN